MEEQVASLEQYFKKCEIQNPEDKIEGDVELIDGDLWEFKNPEAVEFWSFHCIPFTNDISFSYKFKKSSVFIQLSFEENVKDVEIDVHPLIKIKCMTMVPELREKQYHFTICVNSVLIPFNMTPFLTSMATSIYVDEVKELEKKLDNKEWVDADGSPLNRKKLCSKIRYMFKSLNTLRGKLEMKAKINEPRSVSMDLMNVGRTESSRRKVGTESGVEGGESVSGRGKRNIEKQAKSPKKKAVKKADASASKKRDASATKKVAVSKSTEQSEVDDEGNYAENMDTVPHSRITARKVDYKVVSEVYKNFWSTCEDAYILNVGEKVEVDFSQLEAPPVNYNIRSQEDRMVSDMVNWLLNIPDKSNKQALCIMPVGVQEKPKTWAEISAGKFYVINGQHSLAATKYMFDDSNNIDEESRAPFRKWSCFPVWSDDAEKLRAISAYYNRVNHFVATQPSWATNILGSRGVWEIMGRPKNPKEVTSVATTSSIRRTVENATLKENYQVSTYCLVYDFNVLCSSFLAD